MPLNATTSPAIAPLSAPLSTRTSSVAAAAAL
jgi:hypothetical protein